MGIQNILVSLKNPLPSFNASMPPFDGPLIRKKIIVCSHTDVNQNIDNSKKYFDSKSIRQRVAVGT
jgi:hypothetical protein